MFKRSKSASISRQPRHNLAARSSGLYYNSGRRLGQEEQKVSSRPVSRTNLKGQAASPNKWQKLPAVVIALALLCLAAYELGLSSDSKVIVMSSQSQTATNNFLKPTKTYQQAAQKLLKSSLTNRTKVTVDTASIAAKMQQQFPELASVSLALPLIGHQPELYIEPAAEAAVLTTPAGGIYAISDTGKALQRLSSSTNQTTAAGLPILMAQANLAVQVGKIVLPATDITFVRQVIAQFKAANLTIASLTLPPSSDELDVHLAGLAYFVKFNLNDNAGAKQQIGSFLATQHYLAGKSIIPSQYIDVRVDGRAYYK